MDVTRTRQAFDRHALTYDEQFSSLEATQAVRRQVWRTADSLFTSGSRLLDLGCGTGDDAIHFAQRGIYVTSIDISPGMIAQLLVKADGLGVSSRIRTVIADVADYRSDGPPFDAMFSNFGALNCVPNLTEIRSLATQALKPGASLVLVTMGRFYPLETALFLLKGDIRRAFRRFRRKTEVAVEGVNVPVWYHSLNDLRRDLGSEFSLQRTYGLPAVDEALKRFPAMGSMSDHFISVWQYQ